MKKTLVAIAALAVAGGAFAQSSATISGKFRFAYQAANSGAAANAKSNGFAVTDGDVVFAAVEDLGGGLKAGATMAVRVRGRATTSTSSATAVVAPATTLAGSASGAPVDGRDATVFLMGGFGSLVGGSVEAANGIIGFGGAGAPVIGLDNGTTALDGGVNVDWLAYTTPSMGGFTATVQLIDSIGAPGGGGMQTAALTQDATLIGAAYSNGPINFKADYTSFGVNSVATALTTAADTRLRLSGNYNLGVATVGAGFQSKENQAGLKDKQYILGVAAPFGPVTVGANYIRRTDGAGLKATGFDLGVQYNLSKRTYVQAAYQTIDSTTLVNNATQLRLQLAHSF